MAEPKRAGGTVTKLVRPKMSDEQKAAEKANPSLRFKRLANDRVNKAIGRLRQVANLAGPSYSAGRTDADVSAILAAIDAEHAALRNAFSKSKAERESFSI